MVPMDLYIETEAGTFRIHPDAHQWILTKYTTSEKTKEPVRGSSTYHSRLDHCLLYLLDTSCKKGDGRLTPKALSNTWESIRVQAEMAFKGVDHRAAYNGLPVASAGLGEES